MTDSNDVVIAAWNTVLFDKFLRFKHLMVEGLDAHSDELLSRNLHVPGSRVLDVGCGFGNSTIEIAQALGESGEVVGVDCGEKFVAASVAAAKRAGVSNALFRVLDVQQDDLEGPYDSAFSRFGTMFFTAAGAAMQNIRKSLRPGGEFVQLVWRCREDNPWLYDAELAVRKLVPVIDHAETDEVHCGPGPFSLAKENTARAILRFAGFENVTFERFDTDICIGADLGDAVDFSMALGPAGEIMRLAGEDAGARADEVAGALRTALSPYVREDGVWAPSSSWFITARSP